MFKFFAGVITGICLMTATVVKAPDMPRLGAPSSGDFPGIYNATPTALGDGFGGAILTDQYGRVIASSTSE